MLWQTGKVTPFFVAYKSQKQEKMETTNNTINATHLIKVYGENYKTEIKELLFETMNEIVVNTDEVSQKTKSILFAIKNLHQIFCE